MITTAQYKLYEVLYVSTLAPDAPLSVIAAIARKARPANKQRNITGLLIFDGMRFSQLLEGQQKEVLALTERIRQDPRHGNFEVLHHGQLAQRRFRSFGTGYTMLDDDDVLGRLEQLDGQAAIDAFMALQASVDLDC